MDYIASQTIFLLRHHPRTFKLKNLIGILWACAALNYTDLLLLELILEETLCRIKNTQHLKTNDLATITHSLAKLDIKELHIANDLQHNLFKILSESSSTFSPHNLQRVSLSLAKSENPYMPLFRTIKQKGLELRETCNAYELTTLLHTFATHLVFDEEFFENIGNEIIRKIQENANFATTDLLNIIWSCSELDYYPQKLVNTIYKDLLGRKDLYQSDIAKMAYCFSIFNDAEKVTALLSLLNPALLNPESDEELSYKSLVRVHQASLFAGYTLPKELESSISNILIHTPSNPPRSSKLEEEVVFCLKDLFKKRSHITAGTKIEGLSIDIAAPKLKLVIEVNGPCHYLCDVAGKVTETLNGPSRLKYKTLESQGWSVIVIPFKELGDCKSNVEINDYLRKRLHQFSNKLLVE